MSKTAIYAHGGTERNIKDQIDFCRNRIHLDYDKDTAEKALIFKDISSPSFKSKKELNLLLNEVKSKNITKIYVDDINIFARDMNTIAEVCNELINNNCEVIFGYSKEPLTKEYVNLKLSFTNHIQNSLLKSIRHGKYVKKMINNTTSIVSSSVKDGRRFKKKVGSIKEILNIEVNDYGNSDFEHDNVFWYGGEAASIKTSSGEYKIVARGQVRCNLIAKEDYIDKDGNKVKKGDIIATVIDKNQDGLFKNVMIPFIKNDYELNSILEYEHEKYELNIENNNWFELEFYGLE